MMKRISMLALIAVALCACDKEATAVATPEDYAVLSEEMKKYDDAGVGNPVIAEGPRGDFIIKLAETPQLRAIANKKKTAKFLSTEMPKQYISEGFCLVNIVPYNTLLEMGALDGWCNYRLFCGSEKDMNYDGYYAVELCRE